MNLYPGPTGITPFTRAKAADVNANLQAIADSFAELGATALLRDSTKTGQFPTILPDGSWGWSQGAVDALLRPELLGPLGGSLIAYSYAAKYAPVRRTVGEKLNERVSARDFGAIGDSGRHPLSERFATLAAAQAVYPFATSLNQTLDWAGIQSMLNTARDSEAVNRRVIAYIPAGRYILSDTLKIASGVHLRGDKGSTILDNQNHILNGPQLTNEFPDNFQYTLISGINFHGGQYGVYIDATITEGNKMEDCSFVLQTIANYQCRQLCQTSSWTRCVFNISPYGVVLPGSFSNQLTFYSCEFTNHSWESLRVTGTGEAIFLFGCRMEGGGVPGRSTITLNSVRCFRYIGGYIEHTHTNLLTETNSTSTVSFEGVHFTGASDGKGDFEPYTFISDGIVTFANIHAFRPFRLPQNALLVGCNPKVAYGVNSNVWRYKDAMGGSVKLRQRKPRLEPIHTILRFSLAAPGGAHSVFGTMRVQFLGVDSGTGNGRKVFRTYQFSADNYDVVMGCKVKLTSTDDDLAGPIEITPRQKEGSATSTQVEMEVVYGNVYALEDAESFAIVSIEYEALSTDETNPIRVDAL